MLGKFHNAAYLAGGIRDIGNWYSGGDVNTKAGNTLSYGYAADAFALQVDAIMDGGKDTGKAVDEAQFGLAVVLVISARLRSVMKKLKIRWLQK